MTGTLTGSVDYDVFGLSRSSGGTATAFRFTGEQTDPETGSVFLRSRYYGPGAGRFMSADSVMPNAPGTQGYNLYAYGANNPIRWVDPMGHDTTPSSPFFSGQTLKTACLLTPSCNPGLIAGLAMVTAAAPALPLFGTLPGEAGWAVAALGTVSVMYTLVMCAMDINADYQHGQSIEWGGCGGLAHRLQELVNNSGSSGPVEQPTLLNPNNLTVYPQTPSTPTVGEPTTPAPPPMQPDNCGSNSFSGATLVATDSGEMPIGSLHAGGHVLAWNQGTNTTGKYEVTAVLVHLDPATGELTVDSETIETTPEHPFYTEEYGWLAAGNLVRGEHIYRADGRWGLVDRQSQERWPQVMYNLTVETAPPSSSVASNCSCTTPAHQKSRTMRCKSPLTATTARSGAMLRA